MRILVCGINYAPELTGVGKYTGEMAEALAALGHEICVVTAPPYYQKWQVGAGFCAWRYHSEVLKGVKSMAMSVVGAASAIRAKTCFTSGIFRD